MGRQIIRYLIVWCVATLIVVLAVPFARVAIIERALDRAQELHRRGRSDDALLELRRVELWSTLYPLLAQQLNSQAVCYHVGLDDFAQAEVRANHMLRKRFSTPRPAVSFFEVLQFAPNGLINRHLADTGYATAASPSAGYEYLVGVLIRRDDRKALERVATDLRAIDPDNPMTSRVCRFLGGEPAVSEAAAPDPPPDPPTDADGPPAEPPARADAPPPPPPPSAEGDPAEQALAHLERGNWKEALRVCDLALAAQPKHSDLLALRKRASDYGSLRWGVVKHPDASAYDTHGKLKAKITAGALLEISRIVTSESGEFAVCRIQRPQGMTPELCIRTSDMSVYQGGLASVPDSEKRLRVQEATLLGQIRSRSDQLERERDLRNPHTTAYRSALTAYEDYGKQVKDLTRKRDTSTGAKRIAYADELRKMLTENIRLRNAWEDARSRYTTWRDQNAINPEADPEVQRLEKKLHDVQTQLMNMDTARQGT